MAREIGSKNIYFAPMYHQLNSEIHELEKKLKELRVEQESYKGDFLIKCPCCGGMQPLSHSTHIQPLWYEEPWGCTGGAEWHEADYILVPCLECEVDIKINKDYDIAGLAFRDAYADHKSRRID